MVKIYKKIIFILTLLFMISSCTQAKVLEFAQVGDINYVYQNSYLDKYLYFLNMSVNKQEPEFVVFLGDNIKKSTEENVIGFMRCLYSWRIPYYIVLGNNDAHKLNGIEKEVYLDIVTTFNHNQNEGESYYYFKPNSEFICVVLDDTPDFAYSNHGEVSDEQLIWLDKLLTKYSKKRFIIFQHSPVNPPRDEYKLSMLNSEKYKEVIKKHKNIVIMSSGHYKQESVVQDEDGIWHISAPAFESSPHAYQIIKVTYDEKERKQIRNVKVEVTKIKV